MQQEFINSLKNSLFGSTRICSYLFLCTIDAYTYTNFQARLVCEKQYIVRRIVVFCSVNWINVHAYIE